jgi:AraC-like DNA-binding protein
MTPKQAITFHRIEKAKELLQKNQSVTDVAYEVGYSSLSQFITTFRSLTGKLPSEFRT